MRRGHPTWQLALAASIFAVVAVLYAFPLYWLLATSLKSKAELYSGKVTLYPHAPSLEPYLRVLVERGFWVLLRNSVVVCGLSVVAALILGLLITYPITRLEVSPRVRVGILNWALSLRFLPPIAIVVPYFAVVRTFGLYDQPQPSYLSSALISLLCTI